MATAEISATSYFYLFATKWLPNDPMKGTVCVPGGRVIEADAFANLIHCALWQLESFRILELQMMSEARNEVIRIGAANSNVNIRFVIPPPRRTLTGLEAQLFIAARSLVEEKMEDPDTPIGSPDALDIGLRRLLGRLCRGTHHPWNRVADPCYTELHPLHIIESKGWLIPKVIVTDKAGVAALEPRFDELRAQRGALIEQQKSLTNAIVADGIYAHDALDTRLD